MMSTNNENYVNDINGWTSQVERTSSGKERLGTPRSLFSETPMAFES